MIKKLRMNGLQIEALRGIVLHYVAGSRAVQGRLYFLFDTWTKLLIGMTLTIENQYLLNRAHRRFVAFPALLVVRFLFLYL
jgi:hypothetical protein